MSLKHQALESLPHIKDVWIDNEGEWHYVARPFTKHYTREELLAQLTPTPEKATQEVTEEETKSTKKTKKATNGTE